MVSPVDGTNSLLAPSEHMSFTEGDDSAGSDEFNPTPEEKKLATKVNKVFEKYRQHRNNFDHHWMDNYKFFRGRQWNEARPSYRHSEVVNLVFQTIQSQVPILTDARPKFEYMPEEPVDQEFADLLNHMAASDWQRNNWLYKLTEALYDGHIYGTGMSHLLWDPEGGKAKTGAMDYQSQEIFFVYPDPEARDVNLKSDGFIIAEPMELSKIRKMWPERGKFVRSDINDVLNISKNDLDPLRYRSPLGDKTVIEGSSMKLETDQKKAMVIIYYHRDDESFDEEEVNVNGEQMFEQRLQFPKGRRTVVANSVVLEDGPNPYDDGEWPYQRFTNYILPREFWGESEIAQLEGPQKIFNKLLSFALDCLTLTGNPIWVIDNDTGIDADMLTNQPGLVVEKNRGTEARREAGTQLQPYVLQLLDRLKEYVDQLSGSQDITRGIPTGGVTAASAIADLQNAAQTRMRQKARNMDAYLQCFGQQYASRAMQFYTAPRVFRITNDDAASKYFRAHIEKTPEGKPVAVVQQFDDAGNAQPMQQFELRGKLDVRATTGTALSFSKSQQRQEQLELLQLGVIDREEFFKSTDYPNWEAVMQRIEQKEAEAAQAQAQAEAAPAA